MFKQRISNVLKRTVVSLGLLRWWEQHVTPWPRVLLYHYVADESPSFLHNVTVTKQNFLEQISTLQKRYHFLTWSEFRDTLESPSAADRGVLLTFDDGFRTSWEVANELASERQIPAVFFVNTRVLDNAYSPWMIQHYFLRTQAARALEPLWKSISGGKPLSAGDARHRTHQCFGLKEVVEPIEQGLANVGMSPEDLAQKYRLYISSNAIRSRNHLITIGNHSHSHYILTKLREDDLEAELRTSHNILNGLLDSTAECFAYPFGVPGEHFDARCMAALRQIGSYPYIFSGIDTVAPNHLSEIRRVCLDKVPGDQVLANVARISPRALKNSLA